MKTHFLTSTTGALAVAVAALSANLAQATPYATCMTNNGDGTVSFRLNQTTTTNDLVAVIVGTTTNFLQMPQTGPGVLSRGLITTNIAISPSTPFLVRVKHVGTGVVSTNGPSISFNSPRGVAANSRPGSPYFGWVYVGNSAVATGGHGHGMFAYSADLADVTGQGLTARTNGYNMSAGGSSVPYHTSVAPDDSVLVTDWSDASGNLFSLPPNLDPNVSFNYVLKALSAPGAAVTPVGAANNHGSVIGAFIVGTGANTKLYTMDEDYQTDPTSGNVTELNSAWEYDIGSGPLPWGNAPNRKLMTPYLATFSGQNQKCEVYGHYLYTNQRRSNPPQHDLYITDLNNLQDPSTYNPSSTPWDAVWTSQDESIAEGYSDDVFRDTMTTSVSPDQKWLAAVIAGGSATITAPDGSTFANAANDVIVVPLTNGIPNIPARQVFHFGGFGFGRDVAFDAAHNLYMVSSGLGILQALDIGESTDVTTGTDGTYDFETPATTVSVAATTPTAYEQGSVPGAFTVTRAAADISQPLTVFYTVTGTAKTNVNYQPLGNSVTIPAGQTVATINVTPIQDNNPDPTLTVVLTVKGSGGYTIGFPLQATVVIADDSTPQLHITSLSTNIFQGTTNDYAALTVTRFGDTNQTVVLNPVDFALGGSAVSNVDYYLTNLPYTLNPGVVNATFPIISPTKHSAAVGSLSILLTNLAGTGYTVTNNTAATTLTLEAVPAETVLFSDDFESDPSGANWNVLFQSYTNGSTDYTVQFDYDYSGGDFGKNLPPIPPAPHSAGGATKGLYMTVNKNAGVSAGLNLYLKNHTFSGNYAVRFDLFLVENSAGTAQEKVEDVLFGINHDGTHNNWFRNSVTGTSPLGAATPSDGLFFDIGADGNGGGGAPYDFAAWCGPTWTNTVNVIGPTNFISRAASTTRQIFKRPPYDSGNALGGDPANQVTISGFNSPTWAEVEVSQVGTPYGNLITYRINNTVIMSYINTNITAAATATTSGTIMVGYCDPWDDLANGSAGSGEGCAIIDNLSVVQLSSLPVITVQPTNQTANLSATVTFNVGATTLTTETNYQWYLNGIAIAHATNASLTLDPVANANYGTYTVAVNDGNYTTWSAAASLAPATGPVINTPPVSRAAVLGSSPTFTVTATTASGVTNYQWQYYGTNASGAGISGQTTKTLTLAGVQPVSFGGPYTVVVNDGFTSVTSSPAAVLTFATPPTVTNSVNGSTFTMTFGSQIGPSYVIEYKTNLTDAAWIPLRTNVGTGSVIIVNDGLHSAATRFYRAQVK